MFVFTQAPVNKTYAYPTPSGAYSEDLYLDTVTQRAAREYALAHARVESIRRRRHSDRSGLRQGEFDNRSLVNVPYGQFRLVSAPCAPAHVYSVEELAYSAWQEEERRRALARQQEAARARALEEAAAREEAARRARARLQAQQEERGRQALLALFGLHAQTVRPEPAPVRVQVPVQRTSGNPTALRKVRFATQALGSPKLVDKKGKGKAVEIPSQRQAEPVSVPVAPPVKPRTLKEELEGRIREEIDPAVQESLLLLYSDIFESQKSSSAITVAGPSGSKHESYHVPVSEASPVPTLASASVSTPTPEAELVKEAIVTTASEESAPTDGANLRRTPTLPPAAAAAKLLKFYRARRARRLSLAQITEVENALRKLEAAFELPERLDFVNPIPALDNAEAESDSVSDIEEPGLLAYTANNTPVHAYEQALNNLLTQLDAVESNGDHEVRGKRKEIVKEIERALEAMERRVEESRERERERSRERARRASGTSETLEAPAVLSKEEATVQEAPGEQVLEVEATSADLEASNEAKEEVKTLASGSSSSDNTSNEPSTALDEDSQSSYSSFEAESSEPSLGDTSDGPNQESADSLLPSTSEETGEPTPALDDASILILTDSPTVAAGTNSAESGLSNIEEDSTVSEPKLHDDDGHPCSIVVPAEVDESSTVAAEEIPSANPSVALAAPEAICRVVSTATDVSDTATFVTAKTELPSPSEDVTSFVGTATTPASGPDTEPMARNLSSTSSLSGAHTFLLTSVSVEEEKERRQSTSSRDDELDIISKEEVEAARNDSDWSDVESALEL